MASLIAVSGTLAAGSVPAALMMLWIMAGVDRNSVSVADATTLSLGYLLLLTTTVLIFRDQRSRTRASALRKRPNRFS